ncbi:MAG: hypothetical protein RLZZ369_543 [Pseudomonadota bacterium]
MDQKKAISELKEQHSATPNGYRKDIDGLRALAVLSVMGFHAFPKEIQGGFIGVDIFFVISGYLISSIIFSNIEKKNFNLTDFYTRRVKRIFPSLITIVLFCLSLGWFSLLADEYKQLGKHIAGGSVFASNLVLWGESGYFDNIAETKPLLHLWSLAVEEQFYIIWPLLAYGIWGRGIKRHWVIAALIATSFGANLYALRVDPATAFYIPLTRFWELLAGALLASLALKKQSSNSVTTFEHGVSLAGAACLARGLTFIDQTKAFPGWWALLPVLGAVLLIGSSQLAWFNRRVLSHPVLIWIGLISYPLYLWHWPLLSYLRIINSKAPDRLLAAAALGLAVVLAWLTYRFIESPIRFSSSKRPAVAGLLATMCGIGAIGLCIHLEAGLPQRSVLANTTFTPAVTAQFVGPHWAYMNNQRCLDKYPFEEAKTYRWWFCMVSHDTSPTLMLLGNSYANQLYPGLTQQPALAQHSILSIGNCDPARNDPNVAPKNTNFNPCSGPRALHQEVFLDKLIAATPSLQYVILDGLQPNPDAKYIAQLQARIDFLEKRNIKVIMFTPHLTSEYDIRGCFSRPFKNSTWNCEILLAERAQRTADFAPMVATISRSNPKVSFFDPNDIFCDKQKCSLRKDNMPLFRDEYHHVSEYGSKLISESFVKWAQTNLPDILLMPRDKPLR